LPAPIVSFPPGRLFGGTGLIVYLRIARPIEALAGRVAYADVTVAVLALLCEAPLPNSPRGERHDGRVLTQAAGGFSLGIAGRVSMGCLKGLLRRFRPHAPSAPHSASIKLTVRGAWSDRLPFAGLGAADPRC
jgi:hypothetical protein